jgi:hypothetical protein
VIFVFVHEENLGILELSYLPLKLEGYFYFVCEGVYKHLHVGCTMHRGWIITFFCIYPNLKSMTNNKYFLDIGLRLQRIRYFCICIGDGIGRLHGVLMWDWLWRAKPCCLVNFFAHYVFRFWFSKTITLLIIVQHSSVKTKAHITHTTYTQHIQCLQIYIIYTPYTTYTLLCTLISRFSTQLEPAQFVHT